MGVNILVSDNVLDMEGFSFREVIEDSGAKFAAFSISELILLALKLSFGKRLLNDLPFDEEGPEEDPLILASEGLGVK